MIRAWGVAGLGPRWGLFRGHSIDRETGTGAKFDKTHTKFRILKLFPDEKRKSPCLKIFPPQNRPRGHSWGDMAVASS